VESKKFSVKDLGSPVTLNENLDNLDHYSMYVNHHVLNVTTPLEAFPGTIQCSKAVVRNYEKPITVEINPNHETRITLEVESRDPELVPFKCLVLDKNKTVIQRFDKFFSKNIIIDQATTTERVHNKNIDILIIQDGGEIFTQGGDISIKANILISKNGKITTYTDREVLSTPDLTPGKDGGRIQLVVEKGYGDLAINLRGTNGGKQTKIPVRPPQAHAGADGSCSTRQTNCDGGKGAKGYPGTEGFKGLPGGESGAAFVNVISKSDFEVSFIYSPGEGSDGGMPSEPGLGGVGGKPSSYVVNDCNHTGGGATFSPSSVTPSCAYRFDGSYGPQGDLGERGKDGEKGDLGKMGISLFSNYEEGQSEGINASWSNLRGYL